MIRLTESILKVRSMEAYKKSRIIFAVENNLANEASWVYNFLSAKQSTGTIHTCSMLCDPRDGGNVGIQTTNQRKMWMTDAMRRHMYMNTILIDRNFFTTEKKQTPASVLELLEVQVRAWSKVMTSKTSHTGETRYTYNGKDAGEDDLCMALLFGNMCYWFYVSRDFEARALQV